MKKFTLYYSAASVLLCGGFVYFFGQAPHGKEDSHPSKVMIADGGQFTLVCGLQKIVEEELDKAVATLHPKKIIAVLADPRTGEILAMANRPIPKGADSSVPQADAISFCYGPGSTFKVLAYADFLLSGQRDDKTAIFCENGAFPLGGKTIKDLVPLGSLSPSEILAKSSNIGVAKMALQVGAAKYCELMQNFGFGHKTGIGLAGESEGIVVPKEAADDLTLARIAFGQAVSVTPIQILMAYGAIANGGTLFRPSIFQDQLGIKQNGIRIIPESVAASLNQALKLAVTDKGTGPHAEFEGIQIAGMTGTSQAINPDGSCSKTEFVTSFAGYFPADHPRVVAVVVVDGANVPTEKNYGGLIAAPIFAQIARKTAFQLHFNQPIASLH